MNSDFRAKRILVLTVSLAPGGAESVVSQLALALHSAGREVSVVSMLTPTAFSEELEAAGVSVVCLGMKPGRPNVGGVVRFFSYLRQYRPNLIHSHMFHANILARFAGLFTGTRIVSTIHSEIESSQRKRSARLRECLYRVTNAACGNMTAVSQRVLKRYVAEKIIPARSIEVIDNGVDLNRFRPCEQLRLQTRKALDWQDSFVWLAVGRLELAKDYPNVIRAFQRLHGLQRASKLVIVGDGHLRSEIRQLIRQTGLHTAISMLGHRSDVPDLLNACDALVMCSTCEGGPLVLLEAGASERPVVSTTVGAAPEIVVPGHTGLLVPPGDTSALTLAMTEVMTLGTDKLAQMGRAARRRIQVQFSLESVHGRYMSVYEKVLTGRPATPSSIPRRIGPALP